MCPKLDEMKPVTLDDDHNAGIIYKLDYQLQSIRRDKYRLLTSMQHGVIFQLQHQIGKKRRRGGGGGRTNERVSKKWDPSAFEHYQEDNQNNSCRAEDVYSCIFTDARNSPQVNNAHPSTQPQTDVVN